MTTELANCAENLATALKRYNALIEYPAHATYVDELSGKMAESANTIEKLRVSLKEAEDIQATIQEDLDEADRVAARKYAGVKSVEDAKNQAEVERQNIKKLMSGLNSDYMRVMLPQDSKQGPGGIALVKGAGCLHAASCEELGCTNAKKTEAINVAGTTDTATGTTDTATGVADAQVRPFAVTSSMFDNVDMDSVKANLNSAQIYFAKKVEAAAPASVALPAQSPISNIRCSCGRC